MGHNRPVHPGPEPAGTLGPYLAKRRFEETPEPEGRTDSAPGPVAAASASFVVQKHAARRLHYDVRLEVDGVLVSWAVPKGPSYDPRAKRLAVHVEDHPLDYASFEGIIPSGNYGAGTVMVWDAGSYRNLTERAGRAVPLGEAVAGGHLSVWLEGSKLRGGWSLTRTGPGRTGQDSWIMVKRRDEHADPSLDIATAAPASVTTGRDLEAIGAQAEAPAWTASTATWERPMLAELAQSSEWPARAGPGWLYERKLDGLRCVAVRNGDQVGLWSRNHNSFSARFPQVVAALARLAVESFTLDGELVAFDGRDFEGFGALQQQRHQARGRLRTVYAVFDVLHLLGQDTRRLALGDRKKLLAQVVENGAELWVVPALSGTPEDLMAQACERGWEGLVAKRAASSYQAGRSPDWRKLKCWASQELVIGGWTEPRGSRAGFGALLVGYHEGESLLYAGKVGTGFTAETLSALHGQLIVLERPSSPFVDPPRERTAHWAHPILVASVAFAEWTRDGRLRHPSFAGLRSDKDPGSVVREDVAR